VGDWKIRSTTLFLVPYSRGVEEERGGIAPLCIGILRSVRGKRVVNNDLLNVKA